MPSNKPQDPEKTGMGGSKDSLLVEFSPSGKKGRFPAGTRLIEAAQALGADINAVCGGRAQCARCQVEVVTRGREAESMGSSAGSLNPMGAEERQCVDTGLMPCNRRLACLARVNGDVLIHVPEESRVHRHASRKGFEIREIEIDPVVRPFYVRVPEAWLGMAEGDLERLVSALEKEWDLNGLTAEFGALPALQSALRSNGWRVTAAVRRNGQIVAVWPGLRKSLQGAAIDIGSTTLAVELYDLGSGDLLASENATNPQVQFGDDLMSRVSHAMNHPGGAREMTDRVRTALRTMIDSAARKAGISASDVSEVTLVGNPIMHHLVLDLNPAQLGVAPFTLVTSRAVELPASQLELGLDNGAMAYFLPCIEGHVGADAAAFLLSEEPWKTAGTTLYVDVGTNAEVFLAKDGRLLAASSPTGPAFEGGQISSGQRAAPGAIERVRIDPDTLQPRFKIIACGPWSDEHGFIEQTRDIGVSGICGSGIIEAIAGLFLAGLITPGGRIDGAAFAGNPRVLKNGRTYSYLLHDGDRKIEITQADVRAIQLAKAALQTTARLLMSRAGVEKIDRVRLAGAFGGQIDPGYAMVLGMFPDCEPDQVTSAGNAAGSGARIALLSASARKQIEMRVRSVEKIETACEADFEQFYIDAMTFPHATDPYVKLQSRIAPPGH